MDPVVAPEGTVEDTMPAVPADAPVADVPVAPVTDASVVAVEAATPAPTPAFASLYGGMATTLLAVVFGMGIIGGLQWTVARIFARERDEHRALTQFVTAMVAIMVGVYVSDMLIAGPNVELLAEGERTAILGFVKDTALMIFAFYFGTKSVSTKGD
jgi:hypothetical protein